jgi:hypothetical protein
MPVFQGLVTEEGLLQLIEYIKTLKQQPGPGAAAAKPERPPGARPASASSEPRQR